MAEVEELERRFERAAEHMRNSTALNVSNEQKLQLYGYFKQAKEGHCNTAKPGFFDFTGRAKWEAWHKLGDMTGKEAMEKYVELVSRLDPGWESSRRPEEPTAKPASGRGLGGGTGGPVMSTMVQDEEEAIPDEKKSVFDWCKEGHVTKLAAMVTEQNVNDKDDQGMTLLHWACDRGHFEVVKLLASRGADLNVQDSDQQTPLHYGSSCEQCDVVAYLLAEGADTTIKDCDGLTAEEVTTNSDMRQLFSTRQS